jgi:hypothetical protein
VRTSGASIAIVTWLALSACATSQFQEREVLRVGPLRDQVVQPSRWSTEVVLDVGTESMTDDEVAVAAAVVGQAFVAVEKPTAGATVVGGDVELAGCRLRVALQRDGTHYLTRCRARLRVDGHTVAATEVEGVRTVPSRAVSAAELMARKAAGQPRDPRIDAEQATQAIVDTAVHARQRLLLGTTDADHPQQPTRRWRATTARAKLAHASTSTGQAAALVDLGAAGNPSDAATVIPWLRDRSALVRTAARHAMGELCDGRSFAAVAPWLTDQGQQRLRACAVLQGLPAPALVPSEDPTAGEPDHEQGPAPPAAVEQGLEDTNRSQRQILGADDE